MPLEKLSSKKLNKEFVQSSKQLNNLESNFQQEKQYYLYINMKEEQGKKKGGLEDLKNKSKKKKNRLVNV